MAKEKSAKKSKKVYGIIGACVGVVIIAIVAVVATVGARQSNKEIELSVDESARVLLLHTEVMMEKLFGNGTGVSESTCETFRDLAKRWDSDTDWFNKSYCKYIFYADYDETEKNTTFYLYDGSHAAIYTFDSGRDYLLNYEFVNDNTRGYSVLIER